MSTTADTTQDVIRRLGRAARDRARLQQKLDEADTHLRDLIKTGFQLGLPGPALADAAGLSKPRVYQIRDDRR